MCRSAIGGASVRRLANDNPPQVIEHLDPLPIIGIAAKAPYRRHVPSCFAMPKVGDEGFESPIGDRRTELAENGQRHHEIAVDVRMNSIGPDGSAPTVFLQVGVGCIHDAVHVDHANSQLGRLVANRVVAGAARPVERRIPTAARRFRGVIEHRHEDDMRPVDRLLDSVHHVPQCLAVVAINVPLPRPRGGMNSPIDFAGIFVNQPVAARDAPLPYVEIELGGQRVDGDRRSVGLQTFPEVGSPLEGGRLAQIGLEQQGGDSWNGGAAARGRCNFRIRIRA